MTVRHWVRRVESSRRAEGGREGGREGWRREGEEVKEEWEREGGDMKKEWERERVG